MIKGLKTSCYGQWMGLKALECSRLRASRNPENPGIRFLRIPGSGFWKNPGISRDPAGGLVVGAQKIVVKIVSTGTRKIVPCTTKPWSSPLKYDVVSYFQFLTWFFFLIWMNMKGMVVPINKSIYKLHIFFNVSILVIWVFQRLHRVPIWQWINQVFPFIKV